MKLEKIMQIRKDFPALDIRVHERPLVYLDNAATLQMPQSVLERINEFYRFHNANIHRGIHRLSEDASAQYEEVRKICCQFLGIDHPKQVIFTSGTTASVNLAAGMVETFLKEGDELVITEMEHHSNYIPWVELAKRKKRKLHIIPVSADGTLNLDMLYQCINKNTRLVALTESSNVTGIENPVEEIVPRIRSLSDAYVLIDGAQGVVHNGKEIRRLAPDFYCFSGHKLGAPSGTGVLYMSENAQAELQPVWYGGGAVQSVQRGKIVYSDAPACFEPGTPNYAGTIGLGEALRYWMRTEEVWGGRKAIFGHEQHLLKLLEKNLAAIPRIHILGKCENRLGCLSFRIEDIHPYDFCRFLDQYGIAARSGHLCAMPYLSAMGCEHVVRFSVAPYNTEQEILYTADVCNEIAELIHRASRGGRKRQR